MERLKELIKICKAYKIDIRDDYDEEKGTISLSYVPDSVKKRSTKTENYYSGEYVFVPGERRIVFSSWYEDHHNGNAHDVQHQIIELNDDELYIMMKREHEHFEFLIKKKLKDIVINELVEARFQSIMNGTYFG